jgi:hypothetical protein
LIPCRIQMPPMSRSSTPATIMIILITAPV